jgi:hypothetical protein
MSRGHRPHAARAGRVAVRSTGAALWVLLAGVLPAQTPGVVATQTAQVVSKVFELGALPYFVGGGLSASLTDGDVQTSLLGGELLATRQVGRWTGGLYAGGARAEVDGTLVNEYHGINLGLGLTIAPATRVLLVQQWSRAPFNGLDYQGVTSLLLAHERMLLGAVSLGAFGGVGNTVDRFLVEGARIRDEFYNGQVGLFARRPLAGGNGLLLSASMATGLDREPNSAVSARAAVETRLVGPLMLETSYAIVRDERPLSGRERVNQQLQVMLKTIIVPRG